MKHVHIPGKATKYARTRYIIVLYSSVLERLAASVFLTWVQHKPGADAVVKAAGVGVGTAGEIAIIIHRQYAHVCQHL